MNDPPGTLPGRKFHHPRRPPAHQSVSLRHTPPAQCEPRATMPSSPNGPASDKANPPSTVSPKLSNTNKQSSGESSDAGKWFENTNNNAMQSHASLADNDPPFVLRNSSSSGTPPEGHESRLPPYATSVPYRPALNHRGTDESSTEDFRSVIDDLTVANKRLKQKLRKYETLYDAHLQDEKLFEVRFHGMPDHKKRELEETLRKFASSLDESTTNYPPISHPPALDPQKTGGSSHTSRFAESGYVSMSASRPNSNAAPSGADGDRRLPSKARIDRQHQNIQSYLLDIPAGLLPRHNVPMTDKSKKKLVVRRLEQIFAGKRSAPGNHAQPLQQEEVAQSAAMADRQAKEATGQHSRKEGHREARIMSLRTEDEDAAVGSLTELVHKSRPYPTVQEQGAAFGSGSPDQRPTRPLDLDPFRAQVPAENMEYIRHLGFTPPDMYSEQSPVDDHGWLYLNLLINMAQLHTINVTPDFVKDAVAEYSSRLELSHDGRKIRWKGGRDLTNDSSASSSEHQGGSSPYDGLYRRLSKSPPKRIKTGHSGESSESIDTEMQARRTARAVREREQGKYAYNPLFFHKEDSEDEDDFYHLDMVSSSNSPAQFQQRGDSSGFSSTAMRSTSSRRRREDGPIIFYNKAKFCTDLSGDRNGSFAANPATYKSITTHPLGASSLASSLSGSMSETRQPGNLVDTEPMDLDLKGSEQVSSSEGDLGFSPDALKNDGGEDSPETMEFEASGLGGVQPEDNFAIKVKRSQVRAESSVRAAGTHKSRYSRHYTKKILEALGEEPSSEDDVQPTVIKSEILSASRKELPSSSLPPASFLPFDSTSSGDIDSDLESESDVSSDPSITSSSDRGPMTALQLLNISPTHQPPQAHNDDPDSDEEDDVDSDSDDSIDLLATARQLDPKTIRQSEREYDAGCAERLASEIIAGSSAATAAGGSGFNTPVSVRDDGSRVYAPNESSSASRGESLKRAPTSDLYRTAWPQMPAKKKSKSPS
ncbi:hypothetical protein EJ04DRAFT_426615 [Polyplosphaeria fusca]|uniref:Frequency clock protein n=1 Tax=Polyplosphaeria fusca TaxID=682080 RepID=A0A9P4RA72_9PLEO|nr:hypothetical protein EJ04DRAFT_426615 [Polyplosphaeria fusca]